MKRSLLFMSELIYALFFAFFASGCTSLMATPASTLAPTNPPRSSDTPAPSATPKPTLTTATSPIPLLTPTLKPTERTKALIELSDNPCAEETGPGSDCDSRISKPVMNTDGRLALVVYGVLFVEQEPGSGIFQQIATHVREPAWSPEGNRLLYTVWDGQFSDAMDIRIWQPSTHTSKSLTQIIPGFPQPPYGILSILWSLDGKRIYMLTSPESGFGMMAASVADLGSLKWNDLLTCDSYCWVWPVGPDRFVLQEHCGAPCERLMACDLSGQPIWPQEFFTYGVFTFSPDSRYLINFGFMDYDPSQGAGLLLSQGSGDPGALINTETGALRILWNDPNHDSYDLQVRPQISPDGRFISFNTISSEGTFLHVIDLRGKPLLELPDAMVLDWKTGGELAVVSQVSQQEKRLDLYQISGNQPTHILPAAAVWITDAAWSQDGARLAITTYDQAAEVGTVYVWSSSDQRLTQVAQHDIAQQPSCIEWMTEDQGFYYTLGAHEGCQANSSLWQYLDETGQSRLVAQIALP